MIKILLKQIAKFFAAALISAVFIYSAHAQSFSQYTFAFGSVTYTGLDKNISTFLASGDEDVSLATPIGFNFLYHGAYYSTFRASSNGFIRLGSDTITGSHYTNLLDDPTYSPVVAPLWDDLDATDSVWCSITGSAPNRVLTVEWKKCKWKYNSSDTVNYSFQVMLSETINEIEFRYGESGSNVSPSASIGLNNYPPDFISVTPDTAGINPVFSTSVADDSVYFFPGEGAGYFYKFTPPGGDFAPPEISNISFTPLLVCSTQDVTVTAGIVDSASGVSGATLFYIVNTGIPQGVPFTLISGDSINGIYSGTIPAQSPGSVITFYIDATDTSSNSGSSTSTTFQYNALIVDAGNDQTVSTGTTATLSATSNVFADHGIKITEVVLFRLGIGATNPYPSYIGSSAEDFIEITNLNPFPVNLGGYYFEAYYGTGIERSYNLPFATLDSNAVLVLHLGPGLDDAANNYYNTGGFEDFYASSDEAGFVIKNSSGFVADAVASNSYVFPSSSLVLPSQWLGNVPGSDGYAGIIRTGQDDNTASNWTVADTSNEMTLGMLNAGLFPNTNNYTIVWNPGGDTTATITTDTLTATTTYTVTVSDGICNISDSVTVNVIAAAVPVAGFYASALVTVDSMNVTLNDTSMNAPSTWQWTITPASFFYTNGTSSSSQNPIVQFTQNGLYTVQLTVTNPSGMDSVVKTDYIMVYCRPFYDTGNVENDYFSGIHLGMINQWMIPNDSIDYHNFYDTDSTILLAGNTYTIAMLSGYPGGDEHVMAWIDYNNNAVFEPTELLGQAIAADSIKPFNIVFTTPVTISVARAVLRIRMVYDSTTFNSCSLGVYGETRDFRVVFGTCTTPLSVNLGSDTTICGTNPFSIVLDAGNPGSSYTWQNGSSTSTITVDSANTYVVDVVDSAGCHGRDSIVIAVNTTGIAPVANFTYTVNVLTASFTNMSSNATAYFWTFGDGGTSTSASPSHAYTATGPYTVILVVTNSCGTDTFTSMILITGIDNPEIKNNELSITPNPSDGNMNIAFELMKKENAALTVYNANGEKVMGYDYGYISGKRNYTLDLSHLAKGNYLLRLNVGNSIIKKMISIQ